MRAAMCTERVLLLCLLLALPARGVQFKASRAGELAQRRNTSNVTALTSFVGTFRLQHAATGRYMDAYESTLNTGRADLEAILRSGQYENVSSFYDRTQEWVISPEEMDTFSIMQHSSGRFLDSREGGTEWYDDWTCYMRPANRFRVTQRWFVVAAPEFGPGAVRILQARDNGKCLTAYNTSQKDFQVRLSDRDDSDPSQIWLLEYVSELPVPLLDGLFIVKQTAVDRRLEAHEIKQVLGEYQSTFCLTRPREFSTDQRFIIRRLKGEVYEITQQSTGLLLCSDPVASNPHVDYSVITCSADMAEEQQWMLIRVGFDGYVLQHVASRRVLAAHESAAGSLEYRAFTAVPTLASLDGNVTSQTWFIERIGAVPTLDGTYKITQVSSGRELMAQQGGVGLSLLAGSSAVGTRSVGVSSGATWFLQVIHGSVYSLSVHGLNNSYLGATGNASSDLDPVGIVPAVEDASDMYYADWVGGDEFRLRQQSTGWYLTANVTATGEWKVGTAKNTSGTNDMWTFTFVSPPCLPNPVTHCPVGYQCGSIDDGCGGQFFCGNTTDGVCPFRNNVTGDTFECLDTRMCACVPLVACRQQAPSDCGGSEDDGCGGVIACAPCILMPEPENITNVTEDNTTNVTNTTPLPTLPPLTTAPPNLSNVTNVTNETIEVPTWPEVAQLVAETFKHEPLDSKLYKVYRFFYYFYYHFYYSAPVHWDLLARAKGNETLAMDMSARLAAVSAAQLLKFAMDHDMVRSAKGVPLSGGQIIRNLGLEYPEVLPQGATVWLAQRSDRLDSVEQKMPMLDIVKFAQESYIKKTDPSLYKPIRPFGLESHNGSSENRTGEEPTPELPKWAPKDLQDTEEFGDDYVMDSNPVA
mmetsp:Transcript_22798/g.52109  ORF Transcript_22798/g.52109 Transcript_22798/m.52109 type:complete len:867 (-) Transcript_22798:59-2659(-)